MTKRNHATKIGIGTKTVIERKIEEKMMMTGSTGEEKRVRDGIHSLISLQYFIVCQMLLQ